jgi:CheY-like chemotaxis protein
MYRIALEGYGAEVLDVRSASAALAELDRWSPDVLVSTLLTTRADHEGRKLIDALRDRDARRGARVPAVAVTPWARGSDRDAVLAMGYQEHCPKPCSPDELVRVIRRLVGGRPGPPLHSDPEA